jgi:hypothetical protein
LAADTDNQGSAKFCKSGFRNLVVFRFFDPVRKVDRKQSEEEQWNSPAEISLEARSWVERVSLSWDLISLPQSHS